jgi:hypothetical protein
MKKLDRYNEYMLNLVVEAILTKTAPLMLSKRFKNLILSIEHPISKRLLDAEIDKTESFKYTYIDLDDKGIDQVSFMTVTKAIEAIIDDKNLNKTDDVTISNDLFKSYNNDNTIVYSKKRSSTSIGRLIVKLFSNEFEAGGKPGEDIQSFSDKFKSKRDIKQLELVHGSDIVHYYNENQYAIKSDEYKGSLGGSCMRYDYCEDYTQFYTDNEDVVSLLILKDIENEDKIRGRALVWKLSEPSGRTYMDRIYTVNVYDEELFKSYAKNEGWLYKSSQSMSSNEEIYDTLTDEKDYLILVVSNVNESSTEEYPYMDTLKYFDTVSQTLTNSDSNYGSDKDIIKIEETDGGHEGGEGNYWSEYYDKYIDINADDIYYCELGNDYRYSEDCTWIEKKSEMATDEYVRDYMIDCDYYRDNNRYVDEEDAVKLYNTNEYASIEYIDYYGLPYSEYIDEYLREDDAVYSKHHDTYLYEDESVEVYTDAEENNKDWRAIDDDTWFEWNYNDEKYDNDVSLEELREYNDLDENDEPKVEEEEE